MSLPLIRYLLSAMKLELLALFVLLAAVALLQREARRLRAARRSVSSPAWQIQTALQMERRPTRRSTRRRMDGRTDE